MKRVISGLFLLIALGALGLILAGALTSGEQLVVRFLTAIIVAAIGLYVISDLRLQASDDDAAAGTRPPTVVSPTEPPAAPVSPPTQAQAPAPAFMPTVTGKRGSLFGPPSGAGAGADMDLTLSVVAEATSVANSAADDISIGRPEVARADERLRAAARPVAADIDDTLTSSYLEEVEERPEWPPVTGAVPAVVAGSPPPVERPRITTGELRALVDPDGTDGEAPAVGPEPARVTVAATGPADDEVADDRTRELALAGLRRPPSLVPAPDALVTNPAPSPFGRLNATGLASGVGLLERPAPEPAPAAASAPAAANPAAEAEPAQALSTIAAASYARAPLADVIDLRPNRPPTTPVLESAIQKGEIEVISSLISQGRLTTDGPITDRDVRTMVYVAFTSSELRKLLMAGGTIDGDNSSIDLGEVEIFYRPALAAAPPAADA